MNDDDAQKPPMDITYSAKGLICSPFKDLEAMPIQPASKASAPGSIEIFPEFDHRPDTRIGWLDKARGEVKGKTSDDRFR